MLRLILLLLWLFSNVSIVLAQKEVYIPNYLRQNTNDGAQFSLDKTHQTDNFIMIWGNGVGTNPASWVNPSNPNDTSLRFNPQKVLAIMEDIYLKFKQFGLLDDREGTNLSKYKVPIIIYGTWGVNGAQGFANGGAVDGVIGAFWVHPNGIRDGGVAAHEFVHSLQSQNAIDFRNSRNLGIAFRNVGIFYETHANFMRNLLYPQAVSIQGMDYYHCEAWNSWKNAYESYHPLMAIMEADGIEIVNRLWREAYDWEAPYQAYKRLMGFTQSQFNDKMYTHLRRMVTCDFNYNNLGHYLRTYRANALNGRDLREIQALYTVLKSKNDSTYFASPEQAPEEYGYNIVPIHPTGPNKTVRVTFKGNKAYNAHTGWRYGFVTELADGTIGRYSPTYNEAQTTAVSFTLQGNEQKLYLFVMGAPHDKITTDTTNDTWQGYPKHFRFPYELSITGGVPEGHQGVDRFRSILKQRGGSKHPNGGGWVASTASVSPSVYVAPYAIVLGNSKLTNNARVENTAIVDGATISGNAKIKDNALIIRGSLKDNAIIQGESTVTDATVSQNALVGMRAVVSNYTLSGTVEVGGDVLVYNRTGNCNNGVHYRLTNYYNDKLLECDGRTATHMDNLDVNNGAGFSLSYTTPNTFERGKAISPLNPSISGAVNGGEIYNITPALPDGLILDGNTGIISGTPNIATSQTNYTIYASNSLGHSSARLTIKVLGNTLDLAGLPSTVQAAGAYSLRKLSSGFTGPAIQVRNSSTNELMDIGFDSNGNLDTVALKGFVGQNNGYVVSWYDQSGQRNHATQLNAAIQPIIVNAGKVVRVNTRPSIVAQGGTAQSLVISTGSILGGTVTVAENYISAVARLDGDTRHSIISNDQPGMYGHALGNNANNSFFAMYNHAFAAGAPNSHPYRKLNLVEANFSTTQGCQGYVNGVQIWSGGNDRGNGGNTTGQVTLFTFQPDISIESSRYISEVIVTRDQRMAESSRCILVTSQTNYYIDNIKTTFLKIKVFLQGALDSASNPLKMHDKLRTTVGILPEDPYSKSANPRFTHHGTGTQATASTVVLNANSGNNDAIVDWVFIELRSANDPAQVVQTQAALLQCDGDVVSPTDGSSPLKFKDLSGQSFYIAVKHRNHLGAMTADPRPLISGETSIDFTTMSDTAVYNIRPNYEGYEMAKLGTIKALWAGDTNQDGKLQYQGSSSDLNVVLSNVLEVQEGATSNNALGSFQGDVDVNGKARYQGIDSDASFILSNILNYSPNAQKQYNYSLFLEQIPTISSTNFNTPSKK